MISQAMLARWLEQFIAEVVALLPAPPDRPPPPPLPQPATSGANTLAGARDWWLNRYSGYPEHCQQILACSSWLATSPGPIPPAPTGGMMP